MSASLELACRRCQWSSVCGPAATLEWLKRAGMTRRDAAPEVDLLEELLRVAAGKLACPECGAAGLEVRKADDDDDDWGPGKACEHCGKPIARERLEIFPNTKLCVPCQQLDDRGELGAAPEYCAKCGSVMTVRQTRGAGITRYVQACPQCGTRG